jgi:thiol:disulfide interchange protein DsbD
MKKKHVSAACVAALGLIVVCGAPAVAKPWWMRSNNSNDTDFLPPDVAFRVSSAVQGNVIHVRWSIADGYYLYRHKIEVQAESPDLMVSAPSLPQGTMKNDPYLGTQEIYTQQLEAKVAYSRSDAGAHPLQIKVTYQGCAEAGLCYLPMTKVLFPVAGAPQSGASGGAKPGSVAAKDIVFKRVAIIGGLFAFLLAGFVLGKGRALTPPP